MIVLLAALAAPAAEGPVAWIRFRGLRRARSEKLKPNMALAVGQEYSQELADGDVVRLMREGFFKSVAIRPLEVKGGVGVLVVVEERPVIEEIVFENRGPVSREELLKPVRSGREKPLDELRALEDCAEIERIYRGKRFPFVRVNYSTRPVPGKRDEVKLAFHISPGPRAPFKRMRFLGNDSIPDGILLGMTTLREPRRSGEGIAPGEFDAETLDSDVREIEAYYRSKGFLDAEVKLVSVDLIRVGQRAHIEAVIEIEEGPLYRARRIEVEGTAALKVEEVMKAIVAPEELPEIFGVRPLPYPLRDGVPFSFAAMQSASSRVHHLYGSKGRYMTQVTGRTRFVEGRFVDVTFNVGEGAPTKIHSVSFRGNTKTDDEVVARELRIEKGDEYDVRKIGKTLQNLRALRYFSYVRHRIRPMARDEVAVVFELEETETGMLQMGFGMSSNESWSGQLMFEQRNFDWKWWPRSVGDSRYPFMGAGQSLSASLMWGEFTTRVRIHYSQPYIFGKPVALGLDYYKFEGSAGLAYTEDRRGLGASWTSRRELSPYRRQFAKFGLSLKDESIKIYDIDESVEAGSPIRDDEGRWLLRRAAASLEYDSRNYPQRPSDGSSFHVRQEVTGGDFLCGDVDILKTTAGFDLFEPMTPPDVQYPVVFHLRVRAGWAQPWGGTDTVPVFERFRAGGIGTIRGFRYRSIGPWEWDKDGEDRIVLGGSFRWYGTVEISYPLAGDDLRFATFLDWGNVWDDAGDAEIDWDSQKKAAGFGLVLGPYYFPISLYWAWVIDKAPGDREERFSFNMATMF